MDKIIFELIPPPVTWDQGKIAEWVMQIREILLRQEIKYLNLPEVINETRGNGDRKVPFTPKVENLEFAGLIKDRYPETIPVLTKICVRISKEEFREWVRSVYDDGIRQVVIVGGELESAAYPGYSVVEAAQVIKEKFPDIQVGGITIFTRPGEVQRILHKIESGIDFFISQIVFETANMKHVISHLSKECALKSLPFPLIYISLSPAACIRDIEFMKWLGVEFPSALLSYLVEEGGEQVQNRTFEILEGVLDEIFDFMKRESIELGFNVEHVMYTNLHLAEKLLQGIKRGMTVPGP